MAKPKAKSKQKTKRAKRRTAAKSSGGAPKKKVLRLKKTKATKKAASRPGRKRRRLVLVELKRREPTTVQKTVRVPTRILRALEEEAAAVRPDAITVPFAIVQILEDWYAKRTSAVRQAS